MTGSSEIHGPTAPPMGLKKQECARGDTSREKSTDKKLHFKPSAAAINPVINELYILASVNNLLVTADRKGNVKEVYNLDPKIFKQPEGITFTPTGDLLISNEAALTGAANILIYKRKKKG